MWCVCACMARGRSWRDGESVVSQGTPGHHLLTVCAKRPARGGFLKGKVSQVLLALGIGLANLTRRQRSGDRETEIRRFEKEVTDAAGATDPRTVGPRQSGPSRSAAPAGQAGAGAGSGA